MGRKIDYIDALETQLEWHKFTLSPAYQFMWDHIGHTTAGLGKPPYHPDEPALYRLPVQKGEMFFVSREFCSLIESVSEDMPDCYLQEDWVPVPIGFVLFARPLPLPAIEGQEPDDLMLTVKAMGFIRDPAGGLKVACYQPIPNGTMASGWGEKFFPVSYFTWPYGTSMVQKINDYESNATIDGVQGSSRYVKESWQHEIKYLASLMLLMNQRLLATEQVPVERHQVKRFKREVNREIKTLKVVKLRRVVSTATSDEEHRVDWTCRWIVRGHWRQQWYPSRGVNNPVWISPFVKGPEGLPVKEPSKSLFSVER